MMAMICMDQATQHANTPPIIIVYNGTITLLIVDIRQCMQLRETKPKYIVAQYLMAFEHSYRYNTTQIHSGNLMLHVCHT